MTMQRSAGPASVITITTVIVWWLSGCPLVQVTRGSPPAAPVSCRGADWTNCVVANAYGTFPDRTTCRAASAVFPSGEAELLEAVGAAARRKQKMRVVTRWSHSIPKLVCPGGQGGLLISTLRLNKIIHVNRSAMRITVQSGVSLRELIDAAARHGLALPHSPYWEGITVGGLLSTGAHGSSLFGRGGAVHEYVVALRIVAPYASSADATISQQRRLGDRGYATIVDLTEADEDLNAARVSLGLLGVISEVTFQLQPMFKRSIVNVQREDADLQNDVAEFGRDHEFGDITWYPYQRVAVYRVDDRAPPNASGDGVNDFVGFRPASTMLLGAVRMAEEAQELSMDALGKCASARLQLMALQGSGWGLSNTPAGTAMRFQRYPVVGFQSMLQASGSCLYGAEDGLLTACPWDPRVRGEFFHQISIGIALSRVGDFISDLKRLRSLNPASLCGLELYNGILLRYVRGSAAYLGAEEDVVMADITYYRARDPGSPRLHQDVLDEIEQMALFKYAGVPHWGKNRNLAFEGAIRKYSRAGKFMRARRRFDPDGLFSNEWTDALLETGNGSAMAMQGKGCAMEGLCVCREDEDCAPDKGYLCRQGRVYADARVCRYEG